MEQRPGRGPHRLGVVRIDRLAAEDDRARPRRHRPSAAPSRHCRGPARRPGPRRAAGRRVGRVGRVVAALVHHGKDGQDRLGRDRVGHPLQARRAPRGTAAPPPGGRGHRSPGSAGRRRPRGRDTPTRSPPRPAAPCAAARPLRPRTRAPPSGPNASAAAPAGGVPADA